MQDISMKHQPLVSVVIATYNMGQYISQAVESVLNQSWNNLEVIVVDDGSTDNTEEVMQQFCGNAKVIYIKNENQGQPRAKNCGIKNTKGDFIAFCDADDLWEPNKLEVQMPLFSSPKIGVVYSEINNINQHGERVTRPNNEKRCSGNVIEQLLLENFVPFGTAVMRKACVAQNGMFNEQYRMGIDWDLWLRYSLDWEFAFTAEPTYIYRIWDGQMSNNYRGRYKHAHLILQNFIAQHGTKIRKSVLDKAVADTYVREANVIAKHEKLFFAPLKGILVGLCKAPGYWFAWKSLIKLILNKR